MHLWSRNPEMIAAWGLAIFLVVTVAAAPWEKLRTSQPHGVVDVTHQRFELSVPAGLRSEAADMHHHHLESRVTTFGVEGP